MGSHRISTPYLMMAMLASSHVHGANLVPNPDFDADVSHWSTGRSQSSYTFDSATGSPSPGSLHMTSPAYSEVLSDCIPVTAPLDVYASAQVKLTSGAVAVLVNLYRDDGCTNYANYVDVRGNLTYGQWHTWSVEHVAIDGTVKSVQIFLTTDGVHGGEANFDTIRFGPSGTTPVRLQSFEVD